MPLERFLLRLFAFAPETTIESEEIRYYATIQSAIGLIRSGVTTIVDMLYGLADAPGFGLMSVVRAYRDLGVRAVLAPAARDRFSIVHEDDCTFLRSYQLI
jgi:cytosine/adenosine deaminase-related metal-dependent hydrolase